MVVSWITNDLAIAEVSDLGHLGMGSDTILIDARMYFDNNEGLPRMDNIFEIVDHIRFQIDRYHRKFIIFCDSGIDRAPFIVLMILKAMMCKMSREYTGEIYKLIRDKRPQIFEHWEWDDY